MGWSRLPTELREWILLYLDEHDLWAAERVGAMRVAMGARFWQRQTRLRFGAEGGRAEYVHWARRALTAEARTLDFGVEFTFRGLLGGAYFTNWRALGIVPGRFGALVFVRTWSERSTYEATLTRFFCPSVLCPIRHHDACGMRAPA